ncbi:ABC transporter permease, partial [Candidatus Woesearchaeota archaeon]|nr:ABC transporter permease [Candidatus Woesearchaeota archaeon]
VSAIRTSVDVLSDFSEDYPALGKRTREIDSELKKVESIDTDFIVNPINTEKMPLYEKETSDAGIAFVFPIVALFVVLLLCSASFIYDKKTHFLMRMKTSTSPIVYLAAKYVFFFVVTAVNFLIILILFEIAGASFAYNLIQIINLIAFITAINTSIGLLIGLVSDSEGVAILFSLIISLPFMLISGILYPIQTMPVVIQFFAKLIPLNYQVTYSKAVMLFGESFGLTWIYFALALFALIYYFMRRN